MLIDEIEAACRSRRLPTDLPDRRHVGYGNMVNQFRTIESRAGRLVRQLEDQRKLRDRRGTLTERFRRATA